MLGAENSSTESRDESVLIDESAEDVSSSEVRGVDIADRGRNVESLRWRALVGGPVRSMPVVVQQTDMTTSTVESANTSTDNFDTSGTVDQVDVSVGQEVYAGEDLATLEPSSIDSALSQDQSTVTEDQSKLASDQSGQSLQSAEQQLSGVQEQVSTDQSTLQSDQATLANTESQAQGNLTQAQAAATTELGHVSTDSTALTSDESMLGTSEAKLQGAMDSYNAAGCPSPPPGSTANCPQLEGAVTATQSEVTKDQATVNADQVAITNDEQTLQADQLALVKTQVQDQTSFDQSTVRVETDQETLAQAQQSAATDQTLVNQGQQDLSLRVQADQSALAAATAQLETEQMNLKNTTLTAPISGKVVAVNMAHGSPVTAQASTVGTQSGSSKPSSVGPSGPQSGAIEIQGSGSFVAQAVVSGADAGQVAVGDHVTLAISGSEDSVDGRVSSLGMAADNGEGLTTRPVTIAVTGAPPGLYSGMSAQATIVTLHRSGVLAVPSDAVHMKGKRSFVDEVVNGKEVQHTVSVGAIGTKLTQITSGLTTGADVFSKGPTT